MSFSPVLAFARKELAKYLDRLSVKAEIALGLFAEFGLSCEVYDPYFDDAFSISVQNGHGYIAGSNERSVLIGVYRLLAEWGVRFVRPGKNGTYYPPSIKACDVHLTEAAANAGSC